MSLSRLLNRTPIENERSNCYSVSEIDNQLLNKIISSRFIGEGVYLIEQFSMPEYSEQYVCTPSFDKLQYPHTDKSWNLTQDLKEVTVYELILPKSIFMPLDTNNHIKLFEKILSLDKVSILTQLLLSKRMDNWREEAISQYEDYLKGSDNPLDSKLMRSVQNRFLKVLNHIGNFKLERDPIEEMERKILQDNFRFECRIVLYEQKHEDYFEKEMVKILQDLQLFNEIKLKKAENKKQIVKNIENRSFQTDSVNQMLSVEEIYSLIGNEGSSYIAVPDRVSKVKPVTSIFKEIQKSSYISKAIDVLPKGERIEENINSETLEQLKTAFKRVNISKKPLKIKSVFQGATLIKVTAEIPSDINFSNIQKNVKNIQAALGDDSISIEIGDEPDTVNIYLPREQRDVLYLRNILESPEFQKYAEEVELPFVIGENTSGELNFACLADLKHLLVAGATGSGKSVFLNILLMSLLSSVPPELLHIMLIDPKQVEFSQYEGFPQVSKIVTDPELAVKLVNSLCIEMEKRYSILAGAKVRNIKQYNSKSEIKMPYLLCIIDEYADLMMTNPAVEDHVVRLSQKARAAGIHLVIATQKPLATIVTSVLKSNLPSAISFRLKTSSDYMTVFGKGIPYTLLGKGDGACQLEGQQKEYDRFQTPVITLDENQEEEIFKRMKLLFDGIEPHEEIEIKEEEQPIDKLKKIIATEEETRISELQKRMGIRINIVSDLVKELVDEGWLEKQGRGFVIVADEDELVKWRE